MLYNTRSIKTLATIHTVWGDTVVLDGYSLAISCVPFEVFYYK